MLHSSVAVRAGARTLCRLAAAASFLLLAELPLIGPPPADALIHWHTAREDSIYAAVDTLCAGRRFDGAIPLIENLLAELAGDDETPAYKEDDARRFLGYLRFASTAPESAQVKLQEAHRLHARMLADDREGQYQPALPDGDSAYALRAEVLGPTHFLTLDSRRWRGFAMVMAGKATEALREFETIREIGRSVTGTNHPVYYMDLNDIAFTEGRLEDMEAAKKHYLEVVDGMKRIEGPLSRSHAFALLQLSYNIATGGRFSEGEMHAREALRILRACEYADPYELQTTLMIHGQLLGLVGRVPEARQELEEAGRVLRSRPGDHTLTLALLLRNQSELLQQEGHLAEAEKRAREALDLATQCHPVGSEELDHFYTTLAIVLGARGDVLASEAILGEILARRMKAYPNVHLMVSAAHLNLAYSKLTRNDPIQAVAHVEAADTIQHELGLTDACGYSVVLRKRAAISQSIGAYAEAESLLTAALAHCRRLCGEQSDWVITIHDRLANLYLEMDSLDLAETHAREALRLRETAAEGHHVAIARDLRILGVVLSLQGDREGARDHLERALRMRLEILGDEHPAVVESWCDVAIEALEAGAFREAVDLLQLAEAAYEAVRPRVARSYSACLFNEAPLHEALAASHLLCGEENAAWEALERSRGRALAETLPPWDVCAESLAVMRDSLHAEAAALDARIKVLETATGHGEVALLADLRSRREKLRAEWIWTELETSRHAPPTRARGDLLATVQQALGHDDAVLGWLSLEDDRLNAPLSWGYVIRNDGDVRWVRLSGVKTDARDDPVVAYHEAIARRPATGAMPTAEAEALCRRYLRPLLPELHGARHLIVIPSGPLAGLPVESLHDPDSQQWIDEAFCVSYAPSARVFAWLRQCPPSPSAHTCLVVGDPVFAEAENPSGPSDGPPAVRTDGSAAQRSALYENPLLLRSAVNGNTDLLRGLPRLAASRHEVQRVAQLHSANALCLTGSGANEMVLHDLARSGALDQFGHIHFATHALIDYEDPENSRLVLTQVGLPDPLEAAKSGGRVYDGCLSMGEIVREWNLHCDLVTLSACDTALGRVLRGEGPLGFVQAFLQAGAHNVVVSRWKVSDQATSLLMERFYSSLLSQPHPAGPVAMAEALRDARAWLRDYQNADGYRPYAHPFFWASFVLYGKDG